MITCVKIFFLADLGNESVLGNTLMSATLNTIMAFYIYVDNYIYMYIYIRETRWGIYKELPGRRHKKFNNDYQKLVIVPQSTYSKPFFLFPITALYTALPLTNNFNFPPSQVDNLTQASLLFLGPPESSLPSTITFFFPLISGEKTFLHICKVHYSFSLKNSSLLA